MRPECKELLEKLAVVMKMQKINEKYYYGEAGSLFKMTNFGFVIAKIEDQFNDSLHPRYISRSYSLNLIS